MYSMPGINDVNKLKRQLKQPTRFCRQEPLVNIPFQRHVPRWLRRKTQRARHDVIRWRIEAALSFPIAYSGSARKRFTPVLIDVRLLGCITRYKKLGVFREIIPVESTIYDAACMRSIPSICLVGVYRAPNGRYYHYRLGQWAVKTADLDRQDTSAVQCMPPNPRRIERVLSSL